MDVTSENKQKSKFWLVVAVNLPISRDKEKKVK